MHTNGYSNNEQEAEGSPPPEEEGRQVHPADPPRVSLSYRFTIPGRPKSKSRPRFARGRAYTDKKTLDAEKRVAELYKGPYFDGPVSLSFTFHPKKTVVTISALDEEISPLTADLTNLCKMVEDGLNGVAYSDDRLVQKLSARKKK